MNFREVFRKIDKLSEENDALLWESFKLIERGFGTYIEVSR
jgi:hypothetical protein